MQLRTLHVCVVLHAGYAVQLLHTVYVQLTPQLVLTHVTLHRPALAHVGGGGGGGHTVVVFFVALYVVCTHVVVLLHTV